MTVELRFLVPGGKATPGPPIGPALGPLGVNAGKVVADINKATAKFAGMMVPVILKIDPATKEYEIEVGTPPTSALALKKIGKEKGASNPGSEVVGNMTLNDVIEIAKEKLPEMNTTSLRSAVLTVLGTLVSAGINVDGKHPKEVQRAIKAGEIQIEG
ncbi:MAG: large subunit ribosomal protein [Candidatus Diapherotrites archaeon]|nr:large subunit ribosomal protein [Candidatus Diapherotrites archaeon]MDN5366658.1 large subunit ribosomal protein [Candidatus Diapherotrites archaeon]